MNHLNMQNITPEQQRNNEEMQYIACYGQSAFNERKLIELSAKEKSRLRDEFAMAAMNGLISRKQGSFSFTETARDSYEIADLMLKAREVKP